MDEKRNLSSLADRKDDALDLSLGFIAFITQWETENTEISLLMASNNYRIGSGFLTPIAQVDGIDCNNICCKVLYRDIRVVDGVHMESPVYEKLYLGFEFRILRQKDFQPLQLF